MWVTVVVVLGCSRGDTANFVGHRSDRRLVRAAPYIHRVLRLLTEQSELERGSRQEARRPLSNALVLTPFYAVFAAQINVYTMCIVLFTHAYACKQTLFIFTQQCLSNLYHLFSLSVGINS